MASPGPSPAESQLLLYAGLHVVCEAYEGSLNAARCRRCGASRNDHWARIGLLSATFPAPARPTPEQIALVEKIREDSLVSATSQHRSFAEYHRKRAEALSALLTAVTGKDTTP